MLGIPELLFRLLIAFFVYWLGEKIIGLINNGELQKILTIILIVAIVLYVIFGGIFIR